MGYGTNITLTKLTWRLDSRKSFMLAKLQTRNIEIQKRIANGKDYQELLPDSLKSEAPGRSSVKDVQDHIETVQQHCRKWNQHQRRVHRSRKKVHLQLKKRKRQKKVEVVVSAIA